MGKTAGILRATFAKENIMFIAHGEKVRKHSRWILAGILILLIPGFIALFTTTGSRDRTEEQLPTLRGKPVNAAEYMSARRDVRDLYYINTGRELPSTPQFQNEWRREAVLRLLQLRKARELGIRAPESLLMQWLQNHPVFRNERGQFDPDRYRRFLIMLNNRGITESRFIELMRQELILGQLRDWVGAGAKVTPQEVSLSYGPMHERVTIDLVQFNMSDNKDPIAVSETDAKAYYDAHKENFRKPALVKVRYAFFAINDLKKTVKVSETEVDNYFEENRHRFPQVMDLTTNIVGGATNVTASVNSNALALAKASIREMLAAIEARRKAGELAQQLAVKVVPDANAPRPDLAKIATEMGATVKETDFFSQNDPLPGISGRSFYEAAFLLARRPEPPFSDAIETPDGCYVLEYLDGKPSRIPGFDEVKQQVIERIQEERRYEATVQQGQTALAKVRELVAAGKSFSNACAELKLKIDTYGPFTASDQEFAAPAAARIQQAVLGMPVNAISEFITTATGGEFFHLRDRQPPDAAAFEADRSRITEQMFLRNRRALYESWLQTLLREEQVDFGKIAVAPPPPAPEPEEEPTEPSPAPPSPTR